jgi:hypothetical protein
MSRRILFAIAILTATASAGTAARPKGPPPATPNGKAVDCVQLNQIRETRVRDDRTIDFIMNNRTVYRNRLPYSCPELGMEEGFSYKTSLSKLCSVDTITVLRRAGGLSRGASCGLGPFQPVTLTAP